MGKIGLHAGGTASERPPLHTFRGRNVSAILQSLAISLLIACASWGLTAGGAFAQAFSVTITVDENGNGRFTNTAGFSSALPFALLPDPGPGGRASAATYGLLNPPGLTAGDLVLLDPGVFTTSDIIRFNPGENGGSLVFYSDNLDGVDALADTGFPSALYTNALARFEVGPEGNNGFIYTPTSGQPGFVTGAAVTYVIRSDTPVPEPASLALLGGALVGLGVLRRRKRA